MINFYIISVHVHKVFQYILNVYDNGNNKKLKLMIYI